MCNDVHIRHRIARLVDRPYRKGMSTRRAELPTTLTTPVVVEVSPMALCTWSHDCHERSLDLRNAQVGRDTTTLQPLTRLGRKYEHRFRDLSLTILTQDFPQVSMHIQAWTALSRSSNSASVLATLRAVGHHLQVLQSTAPGLILASATEGFCCRHVQERRWD